MKLGDKLRSLRAVEGSLRGLGRALTQQELASSMKREIGRGLSQGCCLRNRSLSEITADECGAGRVLGGRANRAACGTRA